ncbi:MAG: hypothetical protein BJ554DRAFT_6863, partial [Olpidium bornovanus]
MPDFDAASTAQPKPAPKTTYQPSIQVREKGDLTRKKMKERQAQVQLNISHSQATPPAEPVGFRTAPLPCRMPDSSRADAFFFHVLRSNMSDCFSSSAFAAGAGAIARAARGDGEPRGAGRRQNQGEICGRPLSDGRDGSPEPAVHRRLLVCAANAASEPRVGRVRGRAARRVVAEAGKADGRRHPAGGSAGEKAHRGGARQGRGGRGPDEGWQRVREVEGGDEDASFYVNVGCHPSTRQISPLVTSAESCSPFEDEEERRMDAERRRLEVQILHEEAIAVKGEVVKEKHEVAQEVKAKSAQLKELAEAEQHELAQENAKKIEQTQAGYARVLEAKKKVAEENQKKAEEIQSANAAMQERAKREAAQEHAKKVELIRQIRQLEAMPLPRNKAVDLTETAGDGLLSEMSIVEVPNLSRVAGKNS